MTVHHLKWKFMTKSMNILTAVSWERLKEHGGFSISTCMVNPLMLFIWRSISPASIWFTSILTTTPQM